MSDWVLTNDAVRHAIAALRARSVHPYFPAYLHLRQRAAIEETTQGIHAVWNDLSPYLQVRNAPSSHPHFRPFTTHGESDAEWLNANLAGSYAASSLRPGQPPLQVVEIAPGRGLFNLRAGHWELARKHLLNEVKMPLWALAGFMLRDHAWEDFDGQPELSDLTTAFVEDFGYNDASGPTELEYLYDLNPPHDLTLFEQFTDGGTS